MATASSWLKTPDRLPPQNEECEQGLLGAILANNRALERVQDFLKPVHFCDPTHGRIYAVATEIVGHGRVANPTTMYAAFDQDEDMIRLGGVGYFSHLLNMAATLINVGDYGRLIHGLYVRRELIEVGNAIVDQAYSAAHQAEPAEQIETAEAALYALAEHGQAKGVVEFAIPLRAAYDDICAVADGGRRRGISTGLKDLDKRLGGFFAPDLVIIAARPAQGKTALALQAALAGATRERPALFFSLEMADVQLAQREIALRSGVPVLTMVTGPITRDQLLAIGDAYKELSQDVAKRLLVDETPGITTAAIRARARRAYRKRGGLSSIIVDYLQLVGSGRGRHENRVQELTEITRDLKGLAKELGVPVIALSQLNRGLENRDDKRPKPADLRESGSIEQDADLIIFIHREEEYLQRSKPQKKAEEDGMKFSSRVMEWESAMEQHRGKGELIIAKHRRGPTTTVEVQWSGEKMSFFDLVHYEDNYGGRY